MGLMTSRKAYGDAALLNRDVKQEKTMINAVVQYGDENIQKTIARRSTSQGQKAKKNINSIL